MATGTVIQIGPRFGTWPKNGLFGRVIFPSCTLHPSQRAMNSPMRSPTATRFAAVDDQNSRSRGRLLVIDERAEAMTISTPSST
jgi:hypothetical protein